MSTFVFKTCANMIYRKMLMIATDQKANEETKRTTNICVNIIFVGLSLHWMNTAKNNLMKVILIK